MKDIKPYGVIYCLTCKVNGKVYIGQSKKFIKRMNCYKNLGCKTQPQIYNALKKHGWENFSYEIIDTGISFQDLNERECYHIFLSNSRNRLYGYNSRGGGKYGEHSEETKKRMGEISKERMKNPEARILLSLYSKGRKHSEETKKRLSLSHKGEKKSEECKRKMSEAKMGHLTSQETRDKISMAHKGRKHSDEARRKMSEASRRRKLLGTPL